MKIFEQWNNVEVLDSIYCPIIDKIYPVVEKTDEYRKLSDASDELNGFWLMTKKFSYDVAVIKG